MVLSLFIKRDCNSMLRTDGMPRNRIEIDKIYWIPDGLVRSSKLQATVSVKDMSLVDSRMGDLIQKLKPM